MMNAADFAREATEYVNRLRRVSSVEEGLKYFTGSLEDSEDVLLYPQDAGLRIREDSNVVTIGLDPSKDAKAKDMLRIIKIEDPENVKYLETNVISPSLYVHSQDDKPYHITTQCFLFTYLNEKDRVWVAEELERLKAHYGKHELDSFWLPCSAPLSEVQDDTPVCIFNRRVSGWDGSEDRPVVELLGAGGHLQSLWDSEKKRFVTRSLTDNLKKEFDEEIGMDLDEQDIIQVGGFENKSSHELVIFYCVKIPSSKLPDILEGSLDNAEEDTDGLFLGTLAETMEYYKKSPDFFAGGAKAAPTNFPNNKVIMERVYRLLGI